MIVNFTFNDIVLYSKGWYKRSENVVDDLGYLLSQVYGYYPVEEGEVAMYMLKYESIIPTLSLLSSATSRLLPVSFMAFK